MATKIIVLGNLTGQIKSAFAKLATLHSKNNFALAIVAGNLFGETDDEEVAELLDGTIKVPLSTYFTVGSTPLPPRIVEKIVAEEEICENLNFLSKRSVVKTSEGIRIATLGGLLDKTIVGGQSKEQHLPFHTSDDAKALRGANSADILLTALWPSPVWKGSKVSGAAGQDTVKAASTDIAELCAALRPKYHFAMGLETSFYEREPFFHPPKGEGETSFDITRFISLASYGNSAKAKAMYAFTLQTDAITALPNGTTVSPFYNRANAPKRRADDMDTGYSRFSHTNDDDRRNKRRRGDRPPPPGPDQCFFCLSNSSLPTHMVCTIGEESYVATAKGPLPSAQTFADQGLNFPGHLIMVPLPHAPMLTTAGMGPDEAAGAFKEMTRFREALQAMIATRSGRRLGSVAWEINRKRGIHAHWQLMPVPADMVRSAAGGDKTGGPSLVEAAFAVEAENLKLPKLEMRDFGIGDEVEGDFFRVWLYAEDDGGGSEDSMGGRVISKMLLMRFDENVRFDLQFGRRVVAKLLGLEDRLKWQDCEQTQEEETKDTEEFRKAFKDWDFTANQED
ncbi:hypothetical protein RB595_009159 [Gaeumannomyces hyphopodioides]